MSLQQTVDVLLRLIARNHQADLAVLTTGETRYSHFATTLVVPLDAPEHILLGWRQARVLPDLTPSAPLIAALNVVLDVLAKEATVHELLVEATRLQWELADSKIADRISGLFAAGQAEPHIVQQHVFRVLSSIEDSDAASHRIAELKADLQDRKHIAEAKSLLQRKLGLTEGQAYVRLQQASRRSRRPIAEIAREVCAEQNLRGRRIA